MAWIADRELRRTYDPAQGLELRAAPGGGPDHRFFYICNLGNLNEQLGGFSASIGEGRPLTLEEACSCPDAKRVSQWIIHGAHHPGLPIKGYALEESKEIIREAMIAFRGVHGAPLGGSLLYEVKFTF